MKKLYPVAAIVVVVSVCGAVLAQNTTKVGKIRFGSEYTKLNAGWKNDQSYTSAEVKEDEAAGRDIIQVHAGFGGYSFRETYSARASYRTIVLATKPDYSLDLSAKKPGLQVYSDTVEWRTANGKPFAAIARIEVFDGSDKGDGKIPPESRIGEYLIVRGLRGYEYINADINADDKNANAKARGIADTAYRRGKK